MPEDKPKPKAQDAIGGVILLGLLAWWIYPSHKEPAQTSAPPAQQAAAISPQGTPKEIFKTSAHDLLVAYRKNEVAVDEQIKGKKIVISGQVQQVSKDGLGSINIKLYTGNKAIPVHLQMNDSETRTVAALRIGDSIEAECESMMLLFGEPSGSSCIVSTPNPSTSNPSTTTGI